MAQPRLPRKTTSATRPAITILDVSESGVTPYIPPPRRDLLRASLTGLTDAERQAFAWHFLDGLTDQEVADRLSITLPESAALLKQLGERVWYGFIDCG